MRRARVKSRRPVRRKLQCSREEMRLEAKRSFVTDGASLVTQTVRNPPVMQKTQVDHWIMKIPWRREWLPCPVFLSEELHGQRSLAGYSPWSRKESDPI